MNLSDLAKYASIFMFVINVLTIIFFFGFHFGAFKHLVSDVKDIKAAVDATEYKVLETAEKVAYIEGRMMNGRRKK